MPAGLHPDLHASMDSPQEGDVSVPLSIALESALVLANLLPICVVLRYKKSKARLATDELIVALSITDILSVVIPSPIGLTAYFNHHWYGGRRTCEFYQLAIVWFQLTSMCLVTFMCFDRWMSLRDTMAYRTPASGHRRIRISILLVYALTLTISCLPLFGLAPESYSASGDSCTSWLIAAPKSRAQHVFYIVFLTMGYANLVTAIVVNCTVIVTLWRFQKKFGIKPSEQANVSAMQIDRRTVVEFSVMVLIVTAIFYLAWLPALSMITVQQLGVEVGQVAVVYSLLSTTLTGLLNPVIYGTFSRAYRLAYTSLLVHASKLLFGCPLSQQDVVSDISSQARHIRSGASTSNSMASLIHPRSNGVPGSRSGDLEVNAIATSNERQASPANQTLVGSDDSVVNPSSSVSDSNLCSRGDTLDMHERTYFGELVNQRDNSCGDLSRDRFGSSLSLISEDSAEIGDDSSIDSYHGNNVPPGRIYSHNAIVQESMI